MAEAVERGLKRREAEGKPIDNVHCSCTIMTGRLDDYMKALVAEREVPITQEYLDCCGEALFKKVYKLYKQRGYRLKLLVANNNSHFLWSRFLGGDILMTINPPVVAADERRQATHPRNHQRRGPPVHRGRAAGQAAGVSGRLL